MSKSTSFDVLVKVVMGGDTAVGKTNLMNRYTKNTFQAESKSTIGNEFSSKVVEQNGKRIKVQVWDTAGQERYRAITRTYYRDAKGCVLAFSLISRKSFEHIEKWIQEIRLNSPDDCCILLVGNKVDLVESGKKRKVLAEEAEQIVKDYNLGGYFETSAKSSTNVDNLFSKFLENVGNAELKDEEKNDSEKVKIDEKNKDKTKKKCC